jgi:molybdopterin adenylyltransferase
MTADDVTPEATHDVIDREAPGYAETIRAESRGHTPLGILTRGVSGIRGRTLIVNFPGSPRAVRQSWRVVEPTLEHARDTLERS